MEPDWESMDEVEATECILRAALERKATEIHLSADHRGAAIYFSTDASLESFGHLPPVICQKVRHYIKQMASIDVFKDPPQEGFSVYDIDGCECTLAVTTQKGSVYEDLLIRIVCL